MIAAFLSFATLTCLFARGTQDGRQAALHRRGLDQRRVGHGIGDDLVDQLLKLAHRSHMGPGDEAILAGIGVGVCSSVIPYVCDQLAMSRLPRASFALLLALLPATVIGAAVLAQVPSLTDLLGIALVMAGVAVHDAGRVA